MKAIFARHGIPKLVFSDNGLEFTSLEFRKFLANWDFEHDTSIPEFAQSNGTVERKIQTVKRTLLKCLKSGDEKDLSLLALRMASDKEKTPSPATKLMKCELQTFLPRIKEFTYQNKTCKQTPRKHKKLSPLNIDDHDYLHDSKTWSRKGKVIKRCE